MRLAPLVAAAAAGLVACHAGAASAAPALVDVIFASGFEVGSTIEDIQRNSAARQGQSFAIGPALVTGIRQSAGNTIFFVQVPPDKGGETYPQYAGIKAFAAPALGAFSIGDCVTFDGTVTEFAGATELTTIQNFTIASANACGSTVVTPFPVGLDDIATDVDSVTAGAQPGLLAEAFEGVVVRVPGVSATAIPASGNFPLQETQNSTGATLVVGSLLFAYPATLGEQFVAVTGVLDQQQQSAGVFDYRLLPRGNADIQK
jgi:hypothetical protein